MQTPDAKNTLRFHRVPNVRVPYARHSAPPRARGGAQAGVRWGWALLQIESTTARRSSLTRPG
eukprot:2232673-Prymnesium_polylepis.1